MTARSEDLYQPPPQSIGAEPEIEPAQADDDGFEEYRSIEAMNWSSLKHMAVSPLLYRWRESHPRPDTEALSLGRVIHVGVLQPEKIDRYIVKPEGMSFSTRDGKAWKAESAKSGKEIISFEDNEVLIRVTESVRNHRDASALLAGTRHEETIRWTDPETGVVCKGRLDAVRPDAVVDLKTCRDLGRFGRDAADLLYHGQLAWYLDGAVVSRACSPDAGAFIVAVETSEPFDCAVFAVRGVELAAGRALWKRLLGEWCACKATGMWPGRHPSTTDLGLPPWAAGFEEV